MGLFGAAVSAMDVSAMTCEMCFPLECHQSAKVRTAVVWEACKRKSQSILALGPDLSKYAVFIAIHDAYHRFENATVAYSYTGGQPMARKYYIFLD